ncbi:MAG: hypothetical protein R6U50_12785, partial [Desulfobacterales bacterium]
MNHVRIPGLKRIEPVVDRLKSRFIPGALLLGYHCVDDGRDYSRSGSVTPQHFAEQLKVLKRSGNVIRLKDLVAMLQEKRRIEPAVVLTF